MSDWDDCPEEDYERESADIAAHVATCTVDGFCVVCQSL